MFKFGNISRQRFAQSSAIDPNKDQTSLLVKGSTEGNWPSDNKGDMGISNQSSPSPSSPYYKNWSMYFAGDDNMLISSTFALGTNDFSIEFFCRFTQFNLDASNIRRIISQSANLATGFQILVSQGDNQILNDITPAGGLIFYTNTNVVGTIDAVNDDQWHHIVFKRVGNYISSYVDGVKKQEILTAGLDLSEATNITIGAYAGNTAVGRYEGWLNNLRINVGDIPYPNDVTVPTTTLQTITGTQLLMFNRAMWYPESSNLLAVTNNGAWPVVDGGGPFEEEYFISEWSQHGTNSYLKTRDEPTLWADLSSGDYTIEGWLWPYQNRGDRTQQTVLFTQGGYQMSWGFPGYWGGLAHFPSGGYTRTGIGYGQYNCWMHFVINRSGSNTSVRINGHHLGGVTTNNIAFGTFFAWGSNQVTSGAADWRILRNESSFDNVAGTYELPKDPMTDTFRNPSDPNNVILLNGPRIENKKSHVSFFNEGKAKHVGFNGYGSARPTQINPFTYSSFYMLRWDGTGMAYTAESEEVKINEFQPFTWEMWVYLENNTSGGIMIHGTNRVAYNDDIAIVIGFSGATLRTGNAGTNSGTNYDLSYPGGVTLSLNTWHHIALTRDDLDDARLYLNGVPGVAVNAPGHVRTNATRTDLTGSPGIFFGRNPYQGWSGGTDTYVTGYICNIRFIKGRSVVPNPPKYDQSPATNDTEFLAFSAPVGGNNDISSNQATITLTNTVSVVNTVQSEFPFIKSATFNPGRNGGSVHLPGSSYLRAIPYGFAIGNRDFTIECWIYSTEFGARNYWIFDERPSGANGMYAALYVISSASGSNLRYYSQTADRIIGPTLSINRWYHVAVMRTNSVTRLFVDGAQVGNNYADNNFYLMTDRLTIGASQNSVGSDAWIGFISNFRYSVGESLYPETGFSKPTLAPTITEKTQILLRFTDINVVDTTNHNVLQLSFEGTTVMRTYNDVAIKKYTGAIQFDGTSHYIYVPHLPNVNKLLLGQLNFTIEVWFYIASADIGVVRGIIGKGAATTGWSIELSTLGQLQFYNGSAVLTTPSVVLTDQWNHVAVVREGLLAFQTKVYLNGTLEISGLVDTDFNQTDSLRIGTNRTGGNRFKGYIDSVRISKDLVRYDQDFIPPDRTFPER